jgi:subtilase family serine protease
LGVVVRKLLVALVALAVVAPAAQADTGDRLLTPDVARNLGVAQLLGAPPPSQTMRIGFALAHPDPAGEDALLGRLFDPSSPDYHRFLDPAEYAERFGVSPATQAAVRAWLAAGGLHVDRVTAAGDYFLASGTAARVQALLKTTLGRYSIGGLDFIANAVAPSVPRSLPIFAVLGLDGSRRHHTMGLKASPNTGAIAPEELRSIYEQPEWATGQGVSVAILGNGATDSAIADLHAFDEEHGLRPLPVDVVHVPADGDFSDTSGNVEWNIDMQAIHGMAPDLEREVLYFAPSLADSELNAALGAWVNDPNGPPIMNASLGECEQIPVVNSILNNPILDPINGNGNPDALPVSQAISQSSEPATTMLLQQAVIEGRQFFAASGDNGSSCTIAYPGANGIANEGLPLTSDPANTPFSTGVGGTVLYSDGKEPAARYQETGWTSSGGNPSPFITAPDYQRGVANLGRPCVLDANGGTSSTGALCRGVPDVAALSGDAISNGYTIVSGGEDASGGGTSLSSPLWAGLWADVTSTAPPGVTYGFANPTIYAIGKDPARYGRAFHDITVGTNGLNPVLAGYDYVTGFGVPRLAGLIDQVQQITGISGRKVGSCTDATAPKSRFRRASTRATRRKLLLAGIASDRGCGAKGAGKVKRVRVAVARLRGKRCSFLALRAGFSKARSCKRAGYLAARGTTKWKLSLRRRLPAGTYRAYVRASDASGNAGKVVSLRFRVR